MNITPTDARALAELVARHYGDVEVVTSTIPARTETVTETVLVDERHWERVPYAPVGFFAKFITAIRVALAYVPFALGTYAGFVGAFFGWLGETVFHRGSGTSLPGKMKATWQRSNEKYEAALHRIRTQLVAETRQVEQTVEVVREIEPERTIQDTVRASRLVSLGRGSIGFRASTGLDGVVVTGPPTLMDSTTLRYPTVPEIDQIFADARRMESSLEHVPWVMDGDAARFNIREATPYGDNLPLRGLERGIKEHFEALERAFLSGQADQFELPAVTDPRILEHLAPTSAPVEAAPAWIQRLRDLVDSQGGRELEHFVESWMERWQQVESTLFTVREDSLRDQIAPECFDLSTSLNYSAFNFYCPRCNFEKLDQLSNRDYSVQGDQINEPINFSVNTRCLLDLDPRLWRCIACEFETTQPIPIHKMLDGILLPAFDRLMDENQVERVRAHQEVRIREIDIRNSLEGEIERAQFDNLGQIDALVEEMERLSVDVSGERLAIATMEEILSAYDVQQNAVMNNIREVGIRADTEIQARTQAVLDRVNQVKDEEMQALREELNTLSRAKKEDDERRDAVQKDIAKNLEETKEAQEQQAADALSATRESTRATRENTRATRTGLHRNERRQAHANAINAAILRRK